MDVVAGILDVDHGCHACPPGEQARMVRGHRSVGATDDEDGTADALPLMPISAAVRLADGLHEHVNVEAWPPSIFALAEPVRPHMRRKPATVEVGDGLRTAGEGDRPIAQRLLDVEMRVSTAR